MENSNENIKFGICPECKVREKDSSEKKLYQCPHCKNWFCEKHVEPKLVVTWNEIQGTKDPFLKEELYEEWKKEGHHPCSVWTVQYFENREIKEKEERERFLRALDKENIVITPYNRSSEVHKDEISPNEDSNKIEKIEKSNQYSKSSEVSKRKISPKDVAIILMLILLIYFIAVRNIMISIFILLVLALTAVIFK
ncbi:Metal binding protein [Candidatus Nanobsidianus stetteri]|uniref:Metal binding protein n=1 Tax=Nanobsidianus stetteri TaxID=1294122 RepID=R1FTT0_NANST|nr:Metal binding protein [Candidatus Nanobsidianus stetteri]